MHKKIFKNSTFSFIFGLLLGTTISLLATFYYAGGRCVRSGRYAAVQTDLREHYSLPQREQIKCDFRSIDATSSSLFKDVRVLCWVMTSPKTLYTRAVRINATWGRHCNKVIFVSSTADADFPAIGLNVPEGRLNLYEKTKKGFQYIWKHHRNDADWFLKADDDTYVIVENLRYLLKHYDTNKPMYFGRKFKPNVNGGYMSGGAGYVLSKAALNRFESALRNGKCPPQRTTMEDIELGRCLRSVGVIAMDSRDGDSRDTFFPFAPHAHLVPGRIPPGHWFWDYIYYPNTNGPNCCSDFAISFHYIDPDMMVVLDYFVYHLQAVGFRKDSCGENKTSTKHWDVSKQLT